MSPEEKYKILERILGDLGRVVVAYSGGVDSSFLLKAAVKTLGTENVLACVAAGASLPQSQYRFAVELAKDMSVEILTVRPGELSDERYVSNKADRCFHCKSHLFAALVDIAKERGFDHVLCGTNFDDLADFRPGNRAVEKFAVKCPLAQAKLTKADIRQLSRGFGLPTADIAASPCLASRVAYGLEITAERLAQVEQAEEFLKSLGFAEFRVRHHGQLCRIEVRAEDIERIASEPMRNKLVEKLRSIGFKFVSLDLEGFRSGSLNEMLTKQEKRESL